MSRARRTISPAFTVGVLTTLAALAPQPAAAHPHVWVTVETTVNYENGTVTGLNQKWTFDEMYAAMAIQGLDTNNDGKYDRKELAELAQVNIDGLKEFDYFTFVKIGDTALKLAEPKDYWLEYADGLLSLHMTMPLEQPVLAGASGINFATYDPSFFIAFDFAKQNGIKLANAPAGCQATLSVPQEDEELAKRLTDAAQVDVNGSVGTDLGIAVAKTVLLSCPKS